MEERKNGMKTQMALFNYNSKEFIYNCHPEGDSSQSGIYFLYADVTIFQILGA